MSRLMPSRMVRRPRRNTRSLMRMTGVSVPDWLGVESFISFTENGRAPIVVRKRQGRGYPPGESWICRSDVSHDRQFSASIARDPDHRLGVLNPAALPPTPFRGMLAGAPIRVTLLLPPSGRQRPVETVLHPHGLDFIIICKSEHCSRSRAGHQGRELNSRNSAEAIDGRDSRRPCRMVRVEEISEAQKKRGGLRLLSV